MRSFTSCFAVMSLVYVGWLSFSLVYRYLFVMLTSVRPLASLLSCPKSSCLLLKSPVVIVLSCLSINPVSISVDGSFFGQYNVVICIESCGVCTIIECCKFFLCLLSCVLVVVSLLMLFLCIIATPLSMLFCGCVIV